jgi:hypothetical protein
VLAVVLMQARDPSCQLQSSLTAVTAQVYKPWSARSEGFTSHAMMMNSGNSTAIAAAPM